MNEKAKKKSNVVCALENTNFFLVYLVCLQKVFALMIFSSLPRSTEGCQRYFCHYFFTSNHLHQWHQYWSPKSATYLARGKQQRCNRYCPLSLSKRTLFLASLLRLHFSWLKQKIPHTHTLSITLFQFGNRQRRRREDALKPIKVSLSYFGKDVLF